MSDRALTAHHTHTDLHNIPIRQRQPPPKHPRRQHHILDQQLPPLPSNPRLRHLSYRAIGQLALKHPIYRSNNLRVLANCRPAT
ncbi:hypothetical protein [Mycobacteroides abscessus]